jgi:hypothetical protein
VIEKTCGHYAKPRESLHDKEPMPLDWIASLF